MKSPGHSTSASAVCLWLAAWLAAALLTLPGCATRYVERDPDKEDSTDALGDVVVSKTSEDFSKNPPLCLGILPLSAAKKEFEPTQDLRKAIHAHLAPTGIILLPLQRIDASLAPGATDPARLQAVFAATGCDTLMTGEISERQSRFWGVYSEVKMAAALQITRVSTGQVIWRGKHTAVLRAGGLPLDPFSALSGVISAGVNLRDEQLTRTTHDLARRLVAAIPQLKFAEKDSDLAQGAGARLAGQAIPAPGLVGRPSVHAFVSSIEQRPAAQLGPALASALASEDWPEPADRIVLGEFWLKKDSQSSAALFEIASARLALDEPAAALGAAKRAIQIDGQAPEYQFLLGRIYLRLEQPAQATQAMLKAVGAPNPKAMYFTALGLAYNQLGDYALAVAALSRSLQLEPGKAYAMLQIGVAYVGMGDDAEAAKALRQSMILSIANNDHRNASRALAAFKAMDLQAQVSVDELDALEAKIGKLLAS